MKGNLRLTNWKRKQGCRCSMLKKVVDWCGCSPLVFNKRTVYKFSIEVAKQRNLFFGRKFDSLISQYAISVAESQAYRMNLASLQVNHPSFNRTWLNIYSKEIDHSDLLISWSRSLIAGQESSISLKNCMFLTLISIYAYKEDDDADIETIMDVSLLCESRAIVVQFLIKKIAFSSFYDVMVDGFTLLSISVGSDVDLREEIFRNYAGVLSEDEIICTKLLWRQNVGSTNTSDLTSPSVKLEWSSPAGETKVSVVAPYDSVYGGQFGELFPNETYAGEWKVSVMAEISTGEKLLVASSQFLIYSHRHDVSSNVSLVTKYFTVKDICSMTHFSDIILCNETLWSHISPDPKSEFVI